MTPSDAATLPRRLRTSRGRDRGARSVETQVVWPALPLVLLTVLAPLFLGGATPSTQLAIVCLGSACCVASALLLAPRDAMRRMPPAIVGTIFAALWTGVQLVPLPCAWVRTQFPDRAETLDALVSLGVRAAGEKCVLSSAPGSTQLALMLALLVAAIVTASYAVAERGGSQWLGAGLGLSSMTMACVALAHLAVNADLVFGMYEPRQARPTLLLAPLLNSNHLAAHMVLGVPSLIAWGRERDRADVRACAYVGVFITTTAILLSFSRGGIGALVLSLAFYGILRARSLRGRRRSKERYAVLGFVSVACGVATAGAVGWWSLVRIPFDNDGLSLEKLQVPFDLMQLAYAHPWTGIGRGALQDLTPALLGGDDWVLFTENLPSQWMIEWGIGPSLILLTLLASCLLLPACRKARTHAAWAGLVGLVVQNMVDFNLELAGVATVAAVAAGMVLGNSAAARSVDVPKRFAFDPRLAAAALGIACAVGVIAAMPRYLSESRPELRRLLHEAKSLSEPDAQQTLQVGARLYPLDPVLAIYASGLSIADGANSALRWLNVAMASAGGWAAPHVQAAHFLLARHRTDQAAIELSLAADANLGVTRDVLCAFAGSQTSLDALMSAAALKTHREESLELIISCASARPELAKAVGLQAVAEFPASAALAIQLAAAEAATSDVDGAVRRLEPLVSDHGVGGKAATMLVTVLANAGQSERALERFRTLRLGQIRALSLLTVAAGAAAHIGDAGSTREFLEEASLLVPAGTRNRRNHELTAARMLMLARDPGGALRHAQLAHNLEPTTDSAELIYEAASLANAPLVALRMASELCQLRHREERYCPSAGRRNAD